MCINYRIMILLALAGYLPGYTLADWKAQLNQHWNEAKQQSKALYQNYFENGDSICSKIITRELPGGKWEQLLEQLNQATGTLNAYKEAPDHAWFGTDKRTIRPDFNRQLDAIKNLLLQDTAAFSCLQKKQEITRSQAFIHASLSRQREKLLVSAGEDYQKVKQEISLMEQQLKALKNNIGEINRIIQQQLKAAGVILNLEQVDVLMSRVDAQNIIEMVVVFDLLKDVNRRLGELMKINQQDIQATRKYYAMHVIISEMVVSIQAAYLQQLDEQYLPRIRAIEARLDNMLEETRELAENAVGEHQQIYAGNIKAQQLSLKTAGLYKSDLQQQYKNIEDAKKLAEKDLQLADNTYQTVQVSLDLLTLLQSSRKAYQKLLAIQVPKIVPFSNQGIASEYQRLTGQLSP